MMLGFCPGLSSHYPCSWQVPRDPEEGLLEHACHVLQLPPGGSIHLVSEATDGGLGGPSGGRSRHHLGHGPTPPWASGPLYIRERWGWMASQGP